MGIATDRVDWHVETAEATTTALGTDPALGLEPFEAARRLAETGRNELRPPERKSVVRMFLAQFNDFMIWVLMGAVVLSAIEGQLLEAIAILAILLLNGVLGFAQEYRAEQAMEALERMAAPLARVVRGGSEATVPAAEVVPGDIVLLGSGDRIPADGRILQAAALQTQEASLTGESVPVHKHADALPDPEAPLGDRLCMLYAGTSVAIGRARYVVTATGQDTEVGRIADLLAGQEEEKTPLQEELRSVGRRIALAILGIAALVFVVSVARAMVAQGEGIGDAFRDRGFRGLLTQNLLVAISLAVAAIPEGLPAIVTVSLSLGVRLMARHNAIVRRLHAVETLGSTTFICTDKTGTLTVNAMAVRRLIVGEDRADVFPDWAVQPHDRIPHEPDQRLLMTIASCCNDSRFAPDDTPIGDPTEIALLVAADHLTEHLIRPVRIAEVPFDSIRKRMTTVHEIEGHRVAYMKGAPEVVLPLCGEALLRGEVVPLDDALSARLLAMNEELASTGNRTLAFAMRELGEGEVADGRIEHDLTYVGIMGMVDPPRMEVPAAVDACHRAGIHVAMVTGDHALTARAIGSEIGLLEGKRVVSGVELERMSDDELSDMVEDIRIYARVAPEHKLRIVEALKRRGHVVAMTGDGVNDAPALKRADIGVAMGRVGTDVAREASDMVLADDDFATIVEAVRRGRTVFDNLRKFILFLLSCNASEVMIIFTASFISPRPALLPLQLLWNNLVTDGLPALALGVDPESPDVMDRSPRPSAEGFLTRANQRQVLWQGGLITIGGLAVYVWGEYLAPDRGYELGQTMLFTAMVLTQLLHSFSFRSRTRSVFSSESLKNKWLVLALIGSLGAHLAILYVPPFQHVFHTVPLALEHWLAVLVAAAVPVMLIDLTKVVRARRSRV